MANHQHPHPLASVRLAIALAAFFGFPFAIVASVAVGPWGYRTQASDGKAIVILPIFVIQVLMFFVDFILSIVDLRTSQPRRFDAILDGVSALTYTVLFILSLVFGGEYGAITSSPVLVTGWIHIYACIKNAIPSSRLHWTRDQLAAQGGIPLGDKGHFSQSSLGV